MPDSLYDVVKATRDARQRIDPDPDSAAVETAVGKYVDQGWEKVHKAAKRGLDEVKVVIPYRYFGRAKFGALVAQQVSAHFKRHGFTTMVLSTLFLDRPEVYIRWNADAALPEPRNRDGNVPGQPPQPPGII